MRALIAALVLALCVVATEPASAQDKNAAPKADKAERKVRVRSTVAVLDPKTEMKDIISELRSRRREGEPRGDRAAHGAGARETGPRAGASRARGNEARKAETRDNGEARGRSDEAHRERRRDGSSRDRSRRGGSRDRSGHR